MRNAVCLLIALALAGVACHNPETKKKAALTPETARAALLQTDTFATRSVGYVPRTSPQVEAFRVVLAQPDARDEFIAILKNGKVAGQLYALCGLYLVDRKAFDENVKPYLAMKQMVNLMEADMIHQEPVANIVSNTRAGISDIASGEFPRDFANDQKKTGATNSQGGRHARAQTGNR